MKHLLLIRNKIYIFLQSTGALDYPGGIPVSLNSSGQQWDFPNAWPPLVVRNLVILKFMLVHISQIRDKDYLHTELS